MKANDKKDTEDEDRLLQQRNDGEGSMEYDTSNDYDTPSDYESDDPEHMLISLTKWKAGQVGYFCREHARPDYICREGKKKDQEELWKLNKMNARKRCAPVR